MPRFSSKEEQDEYVKNAISTLGALFGRVDMPVEERGVMLTTPAPIKELTCFCGKPPSKIVVSYDELDELVICDDCYSALTTGYSIRAQVRLTSQEGDPTKTGYIHPDYRGQKSYKVLDAG